MANQILLQNQHRAGKGEGAFQHFAHLFESLFFALFFRPDMVGRRKK